MTDKSIMFDIKMHKYAVMPYVYELLEYVFSLSVCCVNSEEFKSLNVADVFGILDKVLENATGVKRPAPIEVDKRMDDFVKKASNDEKLCEILCSDSEDHLMKLLKELANDVFGGSDD